jgi:hypothetical protein
VVLLLPFVLFVWTVRKERWDWIGPFTLTGVLRVMRSLAGGGGPFGLPEGSEPYVGRLARMCLLVIYLGLSGLGAAGAWRVLRRSSSVLERWRCGYVGLWVGVPVVFPLLISLRRSLLVPRYFLVALPPLILLTALGVSRIRVRAIAVLMVAVVGLLSAYGLVVSYRSVKDDWRGAASLVLSRARPGDAITFHFRTGNRPFEYYRLRWAERFPEGVKVDAVPVERVLQSRYPRVWLILSNERPGEARLIQASLAKIYAEVEGADFVGIRVVRYGD